MIHKIIGGKKSQRNVKNSLKYLLRENKNDDEKSFVKIISPTTTKNDILNFNKMISPMNKKNPYIAGVFSFQEKDIDNDIKQKIISSYEDVIFAGIPIEYRPPVLWIEHLDKGRVELNYLTFNALSTGRSFPVYFNETDRAMAINFTEIINMEHGFSSPFDDFSHKFKASLANEPAKNLPKDIKDFVVNLNNELIDLVKEKKLKNRDDLIKVIIDKGYKINRKSDNYISILIPSHSKPIRLKGDIFQANRNYDDIFNNDFIELERTQEESNQRLYKHKDKLQKRLERRTERNKKVYVQPIINRINKKERLLDTRGVTLNSTMEVTTNEYKRDNRESPRSIHIKEIRRIEQQQQRINSKQQFISERFKQYGFEEVGVRKKSANLRRRSRLSRNYFRRYFELFNQCVGYINGLFKRKTIRQKLNEFIKKEKENKERRSEEPRIRPKKS